MRLLAGGAGLHPEAHEPGPHPSACRSQTPSGTPGARTRASVRAFCPRWSCPRPPAAARGKPRTTRPRPASSRRLAWRRQ
eukprot:1475851-Pyramimonas_sp.AAC.1